MNFLALLQMILEGLSAAPPLIAAADQAGEAVYHAIARGDGGPQKIQNVASALSAAASTAATVAAQYAQPAHPANPADPSASSSP